MPKEYNKSNRVTGSENLQYQSNQQHESLLFVKLVTMLKNLAEKPTSAKPLRRSRS